jgi:predicted component of type VI protein secretion system
MPKLVFHDSDGTDKTLPLGTEPVILGRASDCQIQTHDAMVSRKHARITWDGSGYWIEDLGSSNGVFLGAEKIQRAPFRPGEVITCGSLVVRMMADVRRIEGAEPLHSRPMAPVVDRSAAEEFDENVSTSASPALAGVGEAMKLRGELKREAERREQAEAALLTAAEKAASAEVAARELIQLRRRVEQMQQDLRAAHDAKASDQAAIDLDEVAEATAVFNDALAGLKAHVRAALDEAQLLVAPPASVKVVRESLRSAMDELERARERLREMVRMLGLKT